MDDQLIEDLSKDYNSEDNAILNCVTTNYTKANIHEQHNNLTFWILDSGASLHISNSTKHLSNIKHCNEYVHLLNGKTVLSNTQGPFTDFLFNYKIIFLNNVYYVPNITRNIISITNLIKNQNFKIIFYNNNQRSCATIYDHYMETE